VIVVGGGNSGIEAALDLVKIVKHVTVLEFMPVCKADQILIDRLIKHENVDIITNAHIQEIENRDGKVSGVIYKNRETNETNIISTEGVFIQIGLTPNSDFVKDLINTNKFGEIVIDAKCRTTVEGIFAAGDVTNVPYKQIVIGIGEGAKAGISVADYIKTI
jgi:alkyl hydroperoxide reductase subunit F